ncbi:MAG: hypothetical protein J0L73_25890 [Verrucomicrobia bacterium]|nr:hypothetical protein [Verrucomicrobiota bacterium]
MKPGPFRRVLLLAILCCRTVAAADGAVAADPMPAALSQSGFVSVTTDEYLKAWVSLSNNFIDPDTRWPICDVTIKDGKLAVVVHRPDHPKTQAWSPQTVSFSTDMSGVNHWFKKPTHMMRVGEDWLCAYAYGEFGNACWLFSKTGDKRALLTKNQIISLAAVKGRFFTTTFDSNKYESFFSELIPGRTPQLKPLNGLQMSSSGFLMMFPSPDKETLFLIDQTQMARWNVRTGASTVLRPSDPSFAYLASDTHSACEAEGRLWMGGTGFVGSIDPTAADHAIRIFVPRGWPDRAK